MPKHVEKYLISVLTIYMMKLALGRKLLLLWKQITQNYLKRVPYFFFLIGGAALYACSLISIALVENRFHIIAQLSALFFVLLGTYLLLKKSVPLSLFFVSMCFALAVGCRPSALFWSLLIPVVLWNNKKHILNVKSLSAIIIPFAAIGSMLAYYNYARFGSPFEFGFSYMMQHTNQMVFPSLMNPIGSCI